MRPRERAGLHASASEVSGENPRINTFPITLLIKTGAIGARALNGLLAFTTRQLGIAVSFGDLPPIPPLICHERPEASPAMRAHDESSLFGSEIPHNHPTPFPAR